MCKYSKLLLRLSFLIIIISSEVISAELPLTNVPQQTLLDIYQQAILHDPALASSISSNQAAQELIEQGKASYRPTVNFSAEVDEVRSDIHYINLPVSPGKSNFETYKYGVDLRQPIYRKQNLVQIDQAVTQVSQADKQLRLSQQSLILRTTQTYFDVLIAEENVDLILAQKAAILSQLEQAKANFEIGTATITDENEAQARYDLIVAQEISALNQYEIAKSTIKSITGEAPLKLATIKPDLKTIVLKESMEKWMIIAKQNNLNIQIQQDVLRFSEQEIERANAGHMPTLDAVASLSDNYAGGSVSVYGAGNDLKSGVIGLQLQIPIYQGGAISSHVRQAVLNKQRAQDDMEMVIRQTDLETQRAFLNLNTSISQVKAYEQALVSSQSQVDSTKLGYEVGVRTNVDVLNAQQQYFSAKRDLMLSRYNYLVNIIRLKAASGVLAEADLKEVNQELVLNNDY